MSTSAPIATRAPVAIGSMGIVPQTMDDLYRFATAVSKSGLAPKGIETPEAIFVALEMGMEVGLPMMASLQNIAVINGRPTLWGDSQLAVVRNTGELVQFAEWYEVGGKRLDRNPTQFPDDATAVCRVQRQGYEPQDTAFSVADAKRANLWGKAGPWSQYPARMLRFRARSFALRDQFGDALRGLRTAEEVMDDPVEVARNVTPRQPLFAAPQVPAPEPAPADPVDPPADPATEPTADPAQAAAPAPAAEPAKTDLDVKRAKIEAAFIGAGMGFDDLKAFLANRNMDTDAGSFAELEEVGVNRLTTSDQALKSFVAQAKKLAGGVK